VVVDDDAGAYYLQHSCWREGDPCVQEHQGIPFPTWQQQRIYGSLWDAEDWATEGGRIKTDWSGAPFVTYYRNYNVTWCQPSPGVSWCGAEPKDSTHFDLTPQEIADLQWVRDNYMIYNYCTDHMRFNATEFPKECYLSDYWGARVSYYSLLFLLLIN
jgi:xyloglucan:xyloglucosyl transferase